MCAWKQWPDHFFFYNVKEVHVTCVKLNIRTATFLQESSASMETDFMFQYTSYMVSKTVTVTVSVKVLTAKPISTHWNIYCETPEFWSWGIWMAFQNHPAFRIWSARKGKMRQDSTDEADTLLMTMTMKRSKLNISQNIVPGIDSMIHRQTFSSPFAIAPFN